MISIAAAQKRRSLKIILVGSSGVGKTSLISKYMNNEVDKQVLPTVAPASCTSKVTLKDGSTSELQIWDTAGQERFQSISHMFYHGCQIAIVCFDSNSINTINTWVERVLEEVDNCKIFIVWTKIDLLSEKEFEAAKNRSLELKAQVRANEVFLISSLTGEGVHDVFNCAIHYIDDIFPVQPSPIGTFTEAKTVEKKHSKCC